ncbi:MAG: SAM-dependent DNA methyltransferase, partial [Myxococcales bacterium]|nr:SAM-dependent DNA methyltransferase [Myxococcales bacterium]
MSGVADAGAPYERTGSLGFESKLWDAADLLRNNMDPAEYKHVVLGLLFLKYIEDAFEERREELEAAVADPDSEYFVEEGARAAELEDLLEDRDEYTAENVFWVPEPARWSHIRKSAKQATIGKIIDDAMDAIERENPALKQVLPKVFALPNLDKHALGQLIDLVSGIGLGTKEHQDKDTLGRVYEYFLSRFASAEGRGGGEFYTPTSVVRLLVEMLEPYQGRVYDPCCGSGGMFVQSLKFIEAHNGQRKQITVYGQESNRTTWRMARMNLAIRGIEANL